MSSLIAEARSCRSCASWLATAAMFLLNSPTCESIAASADVNVCRLSSEENRSSRWSESVCTACENPFSVRLSAAPLPSRFFAPTSIRSDRAPFLLAPFGPSDSDSWSSAP